MPSDVATESGTEALKKRSEASLLETGLPKPRLPQLPCERLSFQPTTDALAAAAAAAGGGGWVQPGDASLLAAALRANTSVRTAEGPVGSNSRGVQPVRSLKHIVYQEAGSQELFPKP